MQLNEPNDPPLVCQAELNVSVFRPQWPLHNSSPRPFKSFRPKRQSVCTHFQYSRHSSETFTGVGAFDLHSSPTKQVSLICPLVRRGGWDKGEQDGRAGMSPGGLAPYATLWTTLPPPLGYLWSSALLHTHSPTAVRCEKHRYVWKPRQVRSCFDLIINCGAWGKYLSLPWLPYIHSFAQLCKGRGGEEEYPFYL